MIRKRAPRPAGLSPTSTEPPARAVAGEYRCPRCSHGALVSCLPIGASAVREPRAFRREVEYVCSKCRGVFARFEDGADVWWNIAIREIRYPEGGGQRRFDFLREAPVRLVSG